jgi:hypothetical protein
MSNVDCNSEKNVSDLLQNKPKEFSMAKLVKGKSQIKVGPKVREVMDKIANGLPRTMSGLDPMAYGMTIGIILMAAWIQDKKDKRKKRMRKKSRA